MSKNYGYISSNSSEYGSEPFPNLDKQSITSTSNRGSIMTGKRTTMSEAIFGIKSRNNRYTPSSDFKRTSTKGGKRRRQKRRKTVKRRR